MHGDVDRGEQGEALVVETEAVLADVALHREHSAVAHLVEGLALEAACGDRILRKRRTETIEGVVLEDVALHPVLGAPTTRAHQQHELTVRDRPQEPFDERGTEEAGRAGDRDPLSGQVLPDHEQYLIPSVLPPLSTNW